MASTSSSLYDGTCLELRENHCASCGKTEATQEGDNDDGDGGAQPPVLPLVRCSRCCIMRYCNVECQKRDYVGHREGCLAVREAKTKLEQLAAPLRIFTLPDGSTTNLFETRVGGFWAIPETKDFMRQRCALISAHESLALEAESIDAWNVVADLLMESLRLNAKDNMGMRFCFPLALLRANRDDDAYSFCRYWLSRSDEQDRRRRASSKEGDWIYPREKASRYKDILKERQNIARCGELKVLLSLAIIKMRLVAVYEARKKEIEAVAALGEPLGPEELEAVRRRILGTFEHEQTLSDQSRQLDQLLDLIHRRNKVMLAVLLHPGPMLSQRRPTQIDDGNPSEARALIEYAVNVWTTIPGASDYLARRLGTRTPRYLPDLPPIFAVSGPAIPS